jgi:two-component system chemotaxis sensor kinase CheA
MNQPLEVLISKVDALLNRVACDLVLATGEDYAVVRAMLHEAAEIVVGAAREDTSEILHLLSEAETIEPDRLQSRLAVLDATWNTWKALRQVEAAADAPAPSMPEIPVPPPIRKPDDVDLDALRDIMPAAADLPTFDASAEEDLGMLASDPELAGMFVAEALDHLSSIEALVLQVETQPDDRKLLNDIFRPFHTIKGNAGALGVTSVQAVAHRVETLLDMARSGEHVMGAAEIEVILRAVDLLTTMVNGLANRLAGQPGPDVAARCSSLIAHVEALINGQDGTTAPATQPAPPATASPVSSEEIPASTPQAPSVLSITAVAAASSASSKSEPVRASANAVPRATKVVEESLQAVKIDTRKLDNLVDIVGELVIAQSIIQEDPALRQTGDERLARNLAQLKRITSDLQRNTMSMRMMPIRPTFQKMARLVRDLSKKSGKNVELVLSGEDTELDRKVVEEINDPLMHMVRNSLDHGIESPERRIAAGKPIQARITLSASHEGGNIVITIADDGGGLNTEKIRAKAIAQGLIRPDDTLSPHEIHDLIFRPGFSTAEQVTEISGRGVGMDVVRRNIDALRGRIEIHSVAGLGTTFSIKLPLTLAIVEGLLLRCGGQRYVLPTFSVRESLRPLEQQVHSLKGRKRLIQVRNSLIPLIHLAELFGESGTLPPPWEATVVVVEDNGRALGLIVDELLTKQEAVIKSLGDAFAGVRGVAGGAILGDGRVGLILDAGGLFALMDRPMDYAA